MRRAIDKARDARDKVREALWAGALLYGEMGRSALTLVRRPEARAVGRARSA